jgi:hypothetical protein
MSQLEIFVSLVVVNAAVWIFLAFMRDARRFRECRACGHTNGRHLQSCPEAPWR